MGILDRERQKNRDEHSLLRSLKLMMLFFEIRDEIWQVGRECE